MSVRTLWEQLAELNTPAPAPDPENAEMDDTPWLRQQTKEREDEPASMAPSRLRSKATLMDDPVYSGKASSRAKLGMTMPSISPKQHMGRKGRHGIAVADDTKDNTADSTGSEDGSADEDGENSQESGSEQSGLCLGKCL